MYSYQIRKSVQLTPWQINSNTDFRNVDNKQCKPKQWLWSKKVKCWFTPNLGTFLIKTVSNVIFIRNGAVGGILIIMDDGHAGWLCSMGNDDTVYVVHLASIKFGDLCGEQIWRAFSLAIWIVLHKLLVTCHEEFCIGGDFNVAIKEKFAKPPN